MVSVNRYLGYSSDGNHTPMTGAIKYKSTAVPLAPQIANKANDILKDQNPASIEVTKDKKSDEEEKLLASHRSYLVGGNSEDNDDSYLYEGPTQEDVDRYKKQSKKIHSIQPFPEPRDLSALKLFQKIESLRKEQCEIAKKRGESIFFKATTLELPYSLSFNPDGSVLIHFTKTSLDKSNVYGKSMVRKESYVTIKSCMDFDTCTEYASMSCTVEDGEKRKKNFKIVEKLDHFAKLVFTTEKYTSKSKVESKIEQPKDKYTQFGKEPINSPKYTIGEDYEKLRLVTTLGKKGNLSQRLKDFSFYDREINRIAQDIVLGVAGLHQIGYGHFDISPDNIVLTSENRALIIDLENMRSLQDKDLNRLFNVNYTHPIIEERLGKEEINSLFAYMDIWALGYTLYEMCMGKSLIWTEEISISERIRLKRTEWFPEPEDKQSRDHLIWEMVQEKPPSMEEIVSRLNTCFPLK